MHVARFAHQVGLASGLLGGHVGRRAHDPARTGSVGRLRHVLRHAEVGHERGPVLRDEDVPRLQVAVDDPPLVGMMNRRAHLLDDGEGSRGGHPAPRQHGRQRFAFDVIHHEVRLATAVAADLVHGNNVRVPQPGQVPRLVEEPPQGRADLRITGFQHLHGREPPERFCRTR